MSKQSNDLSNKFSGKICETCDNKGFIGGHSGQTAESFEYDTMSCPDCLEKTNITLCNLCNKSIDHCHCNIDIYLWAEYGVRMLSNSSRTDLKDKLGKSEDV